MIPNFLNMPPPFGYYNYSPKHKKNEINLTSKLTNESTLHSQYVNTDEKNKSNTENFVFDLFGIKLYEDDILILCLLFFLYTQGIEDNLLFLSLLLLLIC